MAQVRVWSLAAAAVVVCLLGAGVAAAQHEDSPDPVTGPLTPQGKPPVHKKKHKKTVAVQTGVVAEGPPPAVITPDQIHPITSLPRAGGVQGGSVTGEPTMTVPATTVPGGVGQTIPAMGAETAPVAPAAAPVAAETAAPAAATSPTATAPATAAAPAVPYTQPRPGDVPVAPVAAPAAAAPTATQPADTTTPPAASTTVSPAGDAASAASAPAASVPQPPPMPAPAVVTPSEPPVQAAMMHEDDAPVRVPYERHVRPFSALGIQIKAGIAGGGVDFAVPIAPRMNLRVGGSYFEYNGSYVFSGITTSGTLKLESGTVQVDIFPFGNRFRISPGLTFFNGNHLSGNAIVPAGNTFTLNGASYISDPNSPVRGIAEATLGNRRAPSITLGTGNMIPRHKGHLSIPFEIGIQYIGDPTINYELAGNVCQSYKSVLYCQAFDNPDTEANLQAEEATLKADAHDARFYPIVSVGVAWGFFFGHNRNQ